jgi:catechol-2,3-dioxygenase
VSEAAIMVPMTEMSVLTEDAPGAATLPDGLRLPARRCAWPAHMGHVQLHVGDIDQGQAFYRGVLDGLGHGGADHRSRLTRGVDFAASGAALP